MKTHLISRVTKARRQRVQLAKARQPSSNAQLEPGDLLDFVPRIQPTYQPPVHLAPLADVLERSAHGSLRVVCSVPPRFGKTELVLSAIAWSLLKNPAHQWMYLSYSERLSFSKSKKARTLARRAGVVLSDDSTSAHEWLTPEEGGVRAGGVLQSVTGHGANTMIVDDPHKNRAEAESKILRDKIWDLYTGAVESRMEPDGSVVIIMQRWHEDDLAGRALATGEFELINLKAITDEGVSLWPERWTLEALNRRRRIVGEYDWASQYEGNPTRRGGRLFYDAVLTDGTPVRGRPGNGVDLAHTARQRSDWNASIIMLHIGDTEEGFPLLHIADLRHRQARLADTYRGAELIEAGFNRDILAHQQAWAGARTLQLIGGREDVIAELMAKLESNPVRIEVEQAETDKWVRAQSYAAAWNEGRVSLPRNAPWASTLVKQHSEFTGQAGDADDIVDACVAAFRLLVGGGLRMPTPGGHRRRSAGLRRGGLYT